MKKIVIIGAGPTGLVTAHSLSEKTNYDIKILKLDLNMTQKSSQTCPPNHPKTIPKPSQNHPKSIPKSPQNHPKTIPKNMTKNQSM